MSGNHLGMKNKKTLIFLLPAVLGIWGLIIYRIVDFKGEEDTTTIRTVQLPKILTDNADKTYSLQSHYDDPFLKDLNLGMYARLPQQQPTIETPKAEEKPKPPLNIQYTGYITETGNSKKIALLTVNNRKVFLKAGEKMQNFTLSRIESDSIEVQSEGFSYTFRR